MRGLVCSALIMRGDAVTSSWIGVHERGFTITTHNMTSKMHHSYSIPPLKHPTRLHGALAASACSSEPAAATASC